MNKEEKVAFIEWIVPRAIVANVLDCILEVSEFELHSLYCVYFWTNNLGKGWFYGISTTVGTIYQPLHSGRIWHKVNF